MDMKEIGKLKMHAQAILDCIGSLEGGGYKNDDSEESAEDALSKEAPAKGDSMMAGKSLSMKLGKYK